MPLPLFKLGLAAAAGYLFYSRYRRPRATGSTTNASDAMDDIQLRPDATADEKLDAGVKATFPASDPVDLQPSETEWEKQQRRRRSS